MDYVGGGHPDSHYSWQKGRERPGKSHINMKKLAFHSSEMHLQESTDCVLS